MMAIEMNASADGRQSVANVERAGIFSSLTSCRSLKAAVVGANEPMPSMSKKLVTNPIRMSRMPGAFGVSRSLDAAAFQPERDETAGDQWPSAIKSAVFIRFIRV